MCNSIYQYNENISLENKTCEEEKGEMICQCQALT
jgi:hypothetical protein